MSSIVKLITVLVLLTAAGLKMHQLATVPSCSTFIVDEEKKMKHYPVRIIAAISPRKDGDGSKPESEP